MFRSSLFASFGIPRRPKKSIVGILVPFLVPKWPQNGSQNGPFSKTADPYETCTGIDGSHVRRLPRAPKIETKCKLETGYQKNLLFLSPEGPKAPQGFPGMPKGSQKGPKRGPKSEENHHKWGLKSALGAMGAPKWSKWAPGVQF